MKKFFAIYFLVFLAALFMVACKKTATVNPPPDFNHPNKGCVITNTSDLTGFGAYDLSFTYNAKGDPETFAGMLHITYDRFGRLSRQESSPGNYVEWRYADEISFLPVLSISYYDNERGGTRIFTYDDSGRMVKNDHIYVNSFGGGEVIWQYIYDTKGNVQTIIQPGEALPIFKAISYDDKPNFATSNQWIKYILNDGGSGYITVNYLLFSSNNATQWEVNDVASGFIAPVNSYYQYNSSGFPISDSTVFHDPIGGDFYDVQTNSFKCQ